MSTGTDKPKHYRNGRKKPAAPAPVAPPLKPRTYTVAQLKRMEATLFKAHQAYLKARGALDPVVAQMRGRVVRSRKTGDLYTAGTSRDGWHMLTVCACDRGDARAIVNWMANPSEFEVVGS